MVVVSEKKRHDAWSGFLVMVFPCPASSVVRFLSIFFLLFTTIELSSASSGYGSHGVALQGMGILHRRGSRGMADLMVAHVPDSLHPATFRTFLRTLHTSGLLARSDLAFLFSSPSTSSKFSPLIQQENHSLLKLLSHFHHLNRTNSPGVAALARYTKDKDKNKEEPIWGKKGKGFHHSESSYGSIVGFDASELDPENSLSGFLDHVPMGLRRWACYPMLLGRLRRTYNHVLLVDVHRVLLLNDPFTPLRNRTPDSLYFWGHTSLGIVAGKSRGIRRLTNLVFTQIVRTSIQHNNATEVAIFNRLIRPPYFFNNLTVIASGDPLPDSLYTAVMVLHPRPIVINTIKTFFSCCSQIHAQLYTDCLHFQ